jgi:TP901 family phage tail tape measure protein
VVTISKFSNTIQYNLKTTLDSSGLTKLQSQIRQTQSELSRLQSLNLVDDKQVTEAKARLQSLQTALNKSFNTKIGMLDMSAFQKNLAKSGTSIAQLGSAFSVAGSKGTTAFNSLVGQLGRIDTRMQSLSKSTDKVINTIGNTVRWGVIASGFSQVMNSIHSAVDYVKDLDSSLTNIMMVTDYSKEQMNEYAKSANEAAKALGSTTVAMTDATTVFAQQGFDLDKSSQLAELSVKLANASGQDTATTSDQITAYMNAYGLDSSMDKLTSAMNSWAEVANDSAADVEELATAAQKAASTANTVGVSMDQLNAQIATIESVTREAPENIGNGLKTIYARFSDISMGETLDDGVNLGTVTSTLQKVGVDVLDSDGKMREVGNIMEDLMDVWGQMDSTQKNAIATTLAGKYQLSRFEALMNRSDLYDTYKQSSVTGAENGTLDTMNEKYVNSLEGRLNQLQATMEGVFNNLFRTDDFYDMIGALSNAIDLMDKFTQSIGGGSAALTALAAAGTKAFSTQIGRGISNAIVNSSGKATELENKAQKQDLLYQMGAARKDELSSQQQRVLDVASSGLEKQQYMTEEEVEQWNAQLQQVIQSMNTIEELQESVNQKVEAHNKAMSLSGIEGRDLNPSFDTKDLMDMRTINNEQGAVTGTQRYSQQLKTVGELKQDSQEILKSFSNLDLVEQINGLQGLVEEFQIAEKEIPGSTEAITTSIADLNLSIKQLQEGTEDSDAKIQTRLQNTVNSLGGFQQEINNVIESGNLTTNKALEQVAQASNQIKTETAELEAQMEHLESLNQTYDTRETVIQVTNLVSGIGQLAFAWQSFQSLGSLWVDEDTSVGDKVLETVLNLSFTIPTLVTGLQDIVTGYKALKAALDAQNAAEIVVNAAKAAEIALNEKLIKQEQELAAAKGTSTAASEAEAAADTASTAGDVLTSGKGKKNSKKGTSTSTKGISTASKAGKTATKTLTTATTAASSFGTSLKNILSTGGKLLVGAIKLAPIIGEITTAIGVVGTVVGAYSTYQKRIQKTKEAMGQDDDSYATPSDIASQKKNFETLYEQYKEGNATSSQLSEAASEINDTLDNQTLKVLAASGSWSDYKDLLESVSNTKIKDNLENITDAAQQSAKNVENIGSNELLPFITGQSSSSARTKIANQTSSLSNWTGDWEFNQGSSGVQRLEDLDKADKIFEEEISAAQKRLNAAEEGTQEYNELNKTLQDLQADYGALKELEESVAGDRQAYKNNQQEIADTWVSLTQAGDEEYSGLKYNGGSVEDYKNQIRGTDEYQSIVSQFGQETAESILSSFVEGMTSANTDLAKQSAKEDAEISFGQALYTKLDQSDYLSSNSDIQDAISSQNTFGDFGKSAMTEAIQDAIVQNVIEQVNNSSLTEEEKTQLMSNIDWSKPLADILGTVTRAVQTGDITDYSTTDVDDSSKRKSTTLEKYDVSESTFDAYKEQISANGALSETQEKLNKTLKETKEANEDNSDAVKNAKKAVKSFEGETEDLATDLIQTQKGVDSLSENMEEYGDVLREGDKTSLEYSEAMGAVKESMADVLNIDVSNLSNGFIEDNLDDIQALADGDLNALDNLRAAAGQDIALNMYETGNLTPESLDYLQQKAVDLNSMDIEVGADINDQGFVDSLNKMIVNGEASASDINTYLQGIGCEPHFETESVPTTLFSTEGMSVSGNIFGKDFGFDLPPFTISGNVDVPQIVPESDSSGNSSGGTGLRKKSSGSGGGLRSSSSGSSGSGGSGSGGSGSGSSYTPKTKDLIDDEIDRYEVIDTKLDAVSNDLDRIADAQDRLTGSKLISNMTEQISLLEKQRDLEKEKLSIQQQEALELQDKLSGYGISFDSEGFMSNYATVYQNMKDKVNDLVNQYNATSDEEGQEALDEQYDDAYDAFQKFEEVAERYDELIGSDLKDTLVTLQDIEDQIEDIRISAFKTSVDAADEIKDLQESLADFNATFQDIYDEDPFVKAGTSVKKLSYYFDNATKSATEYYDSLIAQMEESAAKDGVSESYKEWAKKQVEAMEEAKAQYGEGTVEEYGTGYLDMALKNMNTILSEINQFNEEGSSSIFGEDSADMYEVAQDIYDQATEYVDDYKSEIQDLRDDILDMIDDINERFENRMDEYQAIVDELEHQANINELLHGDQSYANINQILAAQQNVYKNQIAQYQDQLELLKDMQSTMEEGTEEWQTLEDQILDTTSDMNDMIETSLENLEKQYSNTVNNITDEWIKGVTGGEDLDWIETEWELINQNADYYLDDVNKAYNIQKLQSKYLDLLDDANDLHTQQKITEQMEQQLDYLREKTNLSEYDVEYAEAQLEILQKQIALEDAQNNKNQMKLRRDSQGNYSYVYTADQDDVSSAESDLLDAQNNAYNLSKNQMKQTQDDSISALKSAQSTINDIWTNANLTLEEKQKRTQTILDSLKTYIASVSEQLSTSEKNIIEDFLGMCENLTDENRTQLDDTYEQIKNGNNDAFSEIDERWVSSMENWESLMDDFSASVDEMGKDLESNGESYQESVDELAELVEADFNDITSSIKDCDDATASLANSQTAFIEQLKNDAGSVKAYESQLQEYTSKIADAENQMAAYKNQVNDLQSQLVSYQQENANLQLKIDMLENPSKYGGSSGSGGYSSSNSSDVENLSKRIANSIWAYGDWGNGQTRIDRITERFGYDMYEAVQAWFNDNPAYGYDWIDYDAGYERYASGGYTGSWSDNTGEEKNGKLAILHQKELVLNSTDTENILAAVETVREFATSLKTGLFAQTVSEILGTAQAQQTIGQDVEQSVHITAEFPNANSAADIEEALLSLNDRAIQYAYKTK